MVAVCLGPLCIAGTDVFSDDPSTPYSSKGGGRPAIIMESLRSEVSNALREDARLTVRGITLQHDIGVATAHKIMTENLNMERICARWVPRRLTEDARQKRVSASQTFLKRWRAGGDKFLLATLPPMRPGFTITTRKLNNRLVCGV